MKIVKMIMLFLSITLYKYVHASEEGTELLQIAEFEAQYTYLLKHLAGGGIKQLAMNNIFAYALTKKGNVYRAKRSSTQKNFDFNAAQWKFINTEGAVSSIALYPTHDVEHVQDFIYARHSYFFKDRLFAYNSATKESVFLKGHNRAIYKIGAVFDQAHKRSCLLSASVFPSIQLSINGQLVSSLKNAYLLYAQEHQLVYADLQNQDDAQGHRFERFIGTQFPYKINIVWNTQKLDALQLTRYNKSALNQIKENEIDDDLIVSINNVQDLPLIAMNTTHDNMQTAVVIMPQQKELKITLNYHFDPEFMWNIINGLGPLNLDQQAAITFKNTKICSTFDIKKAYYLSDPTSVLYRFRHCTHVIKREYFGSISAAYATYAVEEVSVDEVIKNRTLSEILLLVYRDTVEGIFLNDLQNNSKESRKLLIDFKGKKILCTYFDQITKILYCVTEDKRGNVVIESKDIIKEVMSYSTSDEKKRAEEGEQYAQKTKEAAAALQKYQKALIKMHNN